MCSAIAWSDVHPTVWIARDPCHTDKTIACLWCQQCSLDICQKAIRHWGKSAIEYLREWCGSSVAHRYGDRGVRSIDAQKLGSECFPQKTWSIIPKIRQHCYHCSLNQFIQKSSNIVGGPLLWTSSSNIEHCCLPFPANNTCFIPGSNKTIRRWMVWC